MSNLLRCPQCAARFAEDFMLQAELRHIALTVSGGAAEAELVERYGEEHGSHSSIPWWLREQIVCPQCGADVVADAVSPRIDAGRRCPICQVPRKASGELSHPRGKVSP